MKPIVIGVGDYQIFDAPAEALFPNTSRPRDSAATMEAIARFAEAIQQHLLWTGTTGLDRLH